MQPAARPDFSRISCSGPRAGRFVRAVRFALPAAALLALAPAGSFAQVVERVVDGDTLIVRDVGRVRLIGVDTPESVHPNRPVEFFGREASAFTKRLVAGKRVRLEYDQRRTDRYGRTLAYVHLPDGTFVNAEIIRRGYGHAYTRFPFKHLDRFRQLDGKRGAPAAACGDPTRRRRRPAPRRRPAQQPRSRAGTTTATAGSLAPKPGGTR